MISDVAALHYAFDKSTGCKITIKEASKHRLYSCPDCAKDVIFRSGLINMAHFAHKARVEGCAFYFNSESVLHFDAKYKLKQFLEKRSLPLEIVRPCMKCNTSFRWEYGLLDEKSTVMVEKPFLHGKGSMQKKADVASIDSTGQIDCIFEICHTNPTLPEDRPEPWFEFDAATVGEVLDNVALDAEKVTLPCIRRTFAPGAETEYGVCSMCENEVAAQKKGSIFFNQRGAGCGKTYESIQLIDKDRRFVDKRYFIYLTKMRSAKEVIFNEFNAQYAKGLLPRFERQQVPESQGNQHRILMERRADKKLVKVIIGTIDSFTFALRDKSRKANASTNFFHELVKEIRDGHMADLGEENSMQYASTEVKLTNQCLIVIDEGQDLEKEYIDAFVKIIARTCIDTYIIGDKLQSILSEKNLFTHLHDAKDDQRVKRPEKDEMPKNIFRRCHNRKFINFINTAVGCFEKHELPAIEDVCTTTDGTCGYDHEDTFDPPFTVDDGFTNVFEMHPLDIERCCDRVVHDMKGKIERHGYLPENFMFIFPIVNENNRLLGALFPKIADFWIQFFKDSKSYTPKLRENMRKSPEYWKNKLQYEEKDGNTYIHVFWHRSVNNQPINLNESKDASKMLSIHASKGNGCECVYLLGMSERVLTCFTGGISDTLVYESLIHVAVTRQKKYLYVGIDGQTKDDVCKRFQDANENRSSAASPDIRNISAKLNTNGIVRQCLQPPFLERIQHNILDYTVFEDWIPKTEAKETIDFGDHIIRRSLMKVKMDMFLLQNGCKQQFAKLKSFIDTTAVEIVYRTCKPSKDDKGEYQKGYYTCLKDLVETIKHNISGEKRSRQLIVPILVFNEDSKSRTDYNKLKHMIEAFVDSIKYKIRKEDYLFCPIECLLYVHLMGLTETPYNLQINIMDVYRIISYMDDCYKRELHHSHCFKCPCASLFEDRPHSIDAHQRIQLSVKNHYSAIERLDHILEVYKTEVHQHLKVRKFDSFKINKFMQDKCREKMNDNKQFTWFNQFDYFLVTDDSVLFTLLIPQLNLFNFQETLTLFLVLAFFLLNLDDKYIEDLDQKTIYGSIVTLDLSYPILINLSDIVKGKNEEWKTLMQDYMLEKFRKETPRICHFFEHHLSKCMHTYAEELPGLSPTKVLTLSVSCIIEEKLKLYDIPKYIVDSFVRIEQDLQRDKLKRKAFLVNSEAFVSLELDLQLTDAVCKYLKLPRDISSDDE